jgi:hypothetical protein
MMQMLQFFALSALESGANLLITQRKLVTMQWELIATQWALIAANEKLLELGEKPFNPKDVDASDARAATLYGSGA